MSLPNGFAGVNIPVIATNLTSRLNQALTIVVSIKTVRGDVLTEDEARFVEENSIVATDYFADQGIPLAQVENAFLICLKNGPRRFARVKPVMEGFKMKISVEYSDDLETYASPIIKEKYDFDYEISRYFD